MFHNNLANDFSTYNYVVGRFSIVIKRHFFFIYEECMSLQMTFTLLTIKSRYTFGPPNKLLQSFLIQSLKWNSVWAAFCASFLELSFHCFILSSSMPSGCGELIEGRVLTRFVCSIAASISETSRADGQILSKSSQASWVLTCSMHCSDAISTGTFSMVL